MAAVLPLSPPQPRNRRVFIENPRTFLIHLSRHAWRRLPLANVVRPTLDGPILVFSGARAARAEELQGRLDDLHVRYKRAFDPQARKVLLLRIRKVHLARVALACGYTWPGNPPGHIEFAPDA
jgi:hypothetical protein